MPRYQPVLVPEPDLTGQPASRYGVVALLGPSQIAAANTLGVGSFRISLNWDERQLKPKGRIDFSDLDAQLERAGTREVLVTLAYSPAWAAPCRACPPDLGAWESFVGTVLRRYKGRQNIVFGIWNEPNGDEFFQDDERATQYGALFRTAARVRNRVAPKTRLAAPETAYHAAKAPLLVGIPYFVEAMARIGEVLKPTDIVSVHWYGAPDAPALARYMQFVAAYADGREVWLTEANGVATCDDVTQQQALATILHTMDSLVVPTWTKTFIYVLHDGLSCSMSLFQPDYTPRAAATWLAAYISRRTQ
jgi:hypothetical protein